MPQIIEHVVQNLFEMILAKFLLTPVDVGPTRSPFSKSYLTTCQKYEIVQSLQTLIELHEFSYNTSCDLMMHVLFQSVVASLIATLSRVLLGLCSAFLCFPSHSL